MASGLALTHSVWHRLGVYILLPEPGATHRETVQPTGCSDGGVSCLSVIALQKPLRKMWLAGSTETRGLSPQPKEMSWGEKPAGPHSLSGTTGLTSSVRPDHLDFHLAPTHLIAATASKMVLRKPWLTF